jgi:hypothetical protein
VLLMVAVQAWPQAALTLHVLTRRLSTRWTA